jgi:hypothetical protein
MAIKIRSKCALMAASVALAVFSFGCSMKEDMEMATRAAEEFHQSLKAHPDGKLSVRVAPLFYQSTGRAEREAYFARVRAVLGAPLSWSPVGVHVDNMPAGRFLSARYQTRFESGVAQESFSWKIEGGQPYLVAYVVSSSLLSPVDSAR